jgi:hypothetical protein
VVITRQRLLDAILDLGRAIEEFAQANGRRGEAPQDQRRVVPLSDADIYCGLQRPRRLGLAARCSPRPGSRLTDR